MSNPTAPDADGLREKLERQIKHIVMHHVIQAHGKNLGQYRTEYVCGCGIPHIVDDHNPNERGIMDRQAEHIAIEISSYITKEHARLLASMRDEWAVWLDSEDIYEPIQVESIVAHFDAAIAKLSGGTERNDND